MNSATRAWIAAVVVVVVGAGGLGLQADQGPAGRAAPTPGRQIVQLPADTELVWPSPPSAKAYDDIDGRRMKQYVEDLAAIARRSRAAGNQFWGRIAGTPSMDETQRWVASKFEQAGLQVQLREYALDPQPLPRSWQITVTRGNRTLSLASASPLISFAQYMPSAEGDLDLDTAWVGLGMASDFIGKDVRGKAVFVYSVATPSSLIQSAAWMGAAERAQKAGARALIVVLAIPGNLSYVSHLQGARLSSDLKLPIFTVGLDDGEQVEALNAQPGAERFSTRVRWKVDTVAGLKAVNVVGVLPGRTDENIVMISHSDGFFEGAADNAAGTAALIGTAEHFAKLPPAQRRRTMYFIATPDHHSGDLGGKWIHDHMQPVLSKTAVILNAEHVTAMEPVWDRPWGSGGRPELIATNQLGSSWWGVNGSTRLATIVKTAFADFGVPTQVMPGGSAGELRAVQFDAPSFYLHNKGVYYHASNDTPDVVPATGLRTAVQAFARIFDEVNGLNLPELRPTAAVAASNPR